MASCFFCRSWTRMWWLSVNANGHAWVTRPKPGWTLWAQHELCMDHRDAGKPGHQSDLLLIWAGEFRYVPLRLRQSKLPFTNNALYICQRNVLKKMDLSPVCASVTGIWWSQHGLPFGWDILWNFHPCFLHVYWKLLDNSVCHWQLRTEAGLQRHLQSGAT